MTRTHLTFLIRLVLIAVLAFGTLATVASTSASSSTAAIGKEGKGGEKKGKSHKGKANKKANKGHGTVRFSDDDGDDDRDDDDRDDDDDDEDKRKDKDDKDDRKGKKVEALAVAVLTIEVECETEDGETTCKFTPDVRDDDHKVTHIVIPTDVVCAPVTESDAELLDPDPVTGITGYTSTGGEAEFTLTFDEDVSADGEAMYWVKTTGSVLPAIGPGLECERAQPLAVPTSTPAPTSAPPLPTLPVVTLTPVTPTAEATTEVTDSTGSVVVEVLDCPIASAEPDYDWFGECQRAGEGSRFQLVPAIGDTTTSLRAVTDAGGQARFSQIEPGTWVLTLMERDWCHAKSDGVNAEGNVIVTAGERTTVWVFTCATAEVVQTPVA